MTWFSWIGVVVAVRENNGPWTCTTFDARGRVTQVVIDQGAATQRIITTNYAVGNDPWVSSVTDPTGTITRPTKRLKASWRSGPEKMAVRAHYMVGGYPAGKRYG